MNDLKKEHIKEKEETIAVLGMDRNIPVSPCNQIFLSIPKTAILNSSVLNILSARFAQI